VTSSPAPAAAAASLRLPRARTAVLLWLVVAAGVVTTSLVGGAAPAGVLPHAVALALGSVLVARAVTAGPEVRVWGPMAAAVVAVAACAVLARLGGPVWSWAPLLGLVAAPLHYRALMAMLALRVRGMLPSAWMDAVGAALVAGAGVCAVLLGPLTTRSGGSELSAALALSRPVVVLVLLAFAVSLVMISGWGTDLRLELLLAAFTAMALAEAAALARFAGLDLPAAATSWGHAASVALMAWAAWRPGPVRAADRTLVGSAAVLAAPAAFLAVCAGVFWVDHVRGLPTSAVVLALLGLGAVGAKIAMVFRELAALQGSRDQAVTDELTGLGNRRALLARLRAPGPVVVLLMDLNRFKDVNDGLGHSAGDELLVAVGRRLQARLGPADLLVRLGGDEYAVVVDAEGARAGAALGRTLWQALRAPFDVGGQTVHVGASVGVAVSDGGASPEELLRRADVAMYAAKTAGTGVRVHDAALDADTRGRLETVEQLRLGLARGELRVHFQPQVAVSGGAVVGLEALVRWQHPRRGLLGPDAFLDLAEQHGLMAELTAQVLEDAVRRAARWRADGRDLHVAVNLSASSLRDAALPDLVAGALLRHGLPASALVLEITETTLMADPERSIAVTQAVVDLGVAVSIDDYGTGYSSLAYLRRLPVAELKVDRAFTADVTRDPRATAIVRTTVDLAHSLGLRLVAEGVEDEETLRRLRRLGCDVSQGYHHSRPLPAEAVDAWLAAHGPAPRGASTVLPRQATGRGETPG